MSDRAADRTGLENTTHEKILARVSPGSRVVEFGCGRGRLARLLKEAGCRVTGIDRDASALEAAREHCERVIAADIDRLVLDDALDGSYDAAVFADVLEHLREPERILDSVRRFLAPNAILLASVPNVAHITNRLDLLRGRFEYVDSGLLDRTHLHFYTRDSVAALVRSCGYRIHEIDTVMVGVPSQAFDRALAEVGLSATEEARWALLAGDSLVLQYVLAAGVADGTEERAAPDGTAAGTGSGGPEKGHGPQGSVPLPILDYAESAEHISRLERDVEALRRDFSEKIRHADLLAAEVDRLRAVLDSATHDRDIWRNDSEVREHERVRLAALVEELFADRRVWQEHANSLEGALGRQTIERDALADRVADLESHWHLGLRIRRALGRWAVDLLGEERAGKLGRAWPRKDRRS